MVVGCVGWVVVGCIGWVVMGRWLIGCVDEERACEMKKKKKREEEGIESDCVRENIIK